MGAAKLYVNGRVEQAGEMQRAKEILIGSGVYRTLCNFGPYFPSKLSRKVRHVETYVQDGFEFTIVESEVASFSLDQLSLSQRYVQREAWFQPCSE